MDKLSGYELSRQWFEFAFEHPECKVQHTALYLWIVELNNQLGWKKQFGLPTGASMEGLSIGDKRTYLSALKDLQTWGFIKVVQPAKNQFQSCIIELCRSKSTPARTTALQRHIQRQNTGTNNGRTPIVKRVNDKPKNDKQNNNGSAGTSTGKKDTWLFNACRTYWLNDVHPGWGFTGVQGAALKSLIGKLKASIKQAGNEPTDVQILNGFKIFMQALPDWFKDKELNVINSKYNEILTQIKTKKNGPNQTDKYADSIFA